MLLCRLPTLLLLDEPLAGMNAHEKLEMSEFVASVNRRLGTTIVLIEHDVGIVMSLCHVVVLDYGRKIADGKPPKCNPTPTSSPHTSARFTEGAMDLFP